MDDRIRASDADRDRITARLREHYAEGRLSTDELEERIDEALSAKTLGDLRRVMTDLPEAEPALTPAGPRPWQMAGPAGPAPYQVTRYRRRGPRFFPLLVIGLFVAFVAAGGGAAAVAVKIIAITVLAAFAFIGLMAFLIARLFHRAQRDWDHGNPHSGHWHHHHHHGRVGSPDNWSRW
jgi:hypothetical protein